MNGLLSNVGGLILLLAIVAFVVFAVVRVGPRFMIRRLLGLVFVIIGVTLITFTLGYFAPGSAVYAQLGSHAGDKLAVARLIHFYGLDQPFWVQYGDFLGRLLHFSLGYSWISSNTTVWEILQQYVPVSVQLGVSGLVLALIFGIPLGILAAVRAGKRTDSVVQTIGLLLYAIPSFVIIPVFFFVMDYLHSQNMPSLSVSGWGTPDTEVAPIIIFGLGAFAYYVRLTRASMLEVLGQDYIRTARAKGLRERVVIFRHGFRNAVLPLLTAIGPAIAFAVAGLFIIEDLFNIPGIGAESLAAILERDFPVVQGTVIILAAAVVVMNLVTDIAYGIADPRVKTQ